LYLHHIQDAERQTERQYCLLTKKYIALVQHSYSIAVLLEII
jgi:hypothetical protein